MEAVHFEALPEVIPMDWVTSGKGLDPTFYLIKDYNKDGGGKYAEYYTPHAVAKIMASCLVTKVRDNVTCYDPSAGSGTLLMNLAHAIGE
ncbi:MAG: N-6 DNA methylase, partial [bacterium]